MSAQRSPRAHRALSLAGLAVTQIAWSTQPPAAAFDWFEYAGHDAVFEQALTPGQYRNPVLAGSYPDPSITRAADHYYLVNSTFAYFPGIPVFESTDLVHWRQIGNVIDRPSELSFDGLGISRGVFAPSIRFHDGLFYVLSTAVDAGGNFLSVAKDPAGPWSDPVWLPQLDGIDPSLFFDDDGRAYLLNNGPPPGKPRYPGHRAIWMQQLDLATRGLIGRRQLLIDGGVHPAANPVWIEGPHLYKRDGWYYLMCAEGGTSTQHSEVVLRARSVWGPFRAWRGNPILTQRDLAATRPDPIADAGHADLVQAGDGHWWAVFLAVRPYQQIHYNTGRETFLLPVTWQHGWPVILEHGESIPYVASAPAGFGADAGDTAAAAADATTGNFTWRDEFDETVLAAQWLYLRTPKQAWADLHSRPGWLTIHALPAALDTLGNPSFLARRQQHTSFDASTSVEMPEAGVAAGIAVFQDERHWYFLGTRRIADGLQLFLERDGGQGIGVMASTTLRPIAGAAPLRAIRLRVSAHARDYSFYYGVDDIGWRALLEHDDGSFLSTDVAGGFVGTVLGPYARAE